MEISITQDHVPQADFPLLIAVGHFREADDSARNGKSASRP